MYFLRIYIYYLLLLIVGNANAQKEKHLVAKFSFNKGNPLDDLGKFNAKVYGAQLTNDRFGNSNSAYYLHGNFASFINLGTSNLLKPTEATISMWFRIDFPILSGRGSEINPLLITKCLAGDDFNEAYGISYNLNSRNISAGVGLSKERQVVMYNSHPVSLRAWHHAVLCYNYDFVSFYLDGEEIGKINKKFESKFLEGDSVLIGGMSGNKNVRFFNGAVDDIEIYNTVLTEQQILELYNAPNPNRNRVILYWSLVGLSIVIAIFVIVWLIRRQVRSILRKEQERNQLLNHALEQEVKMLKAQMDPHFIFNSLNTILQFIILKENEKAELYLTKFSKLIRKLLVSNTQESISLTEELDILKKYVEIESLRFDKVITLIVDIEKSINADSINVPHMMLQPFVENAIWHGLRLKEGEKTLRIILRKVNENTLFCVIDDNGVGRQNDNMFMEISKNKSLAISFIKQRLELMSKKYGRKFTLEIIDKQNEREESEGTRIEITIPILKLEK